MREAHRRAADEFFCLVAHHALRVRADEADRARHVHARGRIAGNFGYLTEPRLAGFGLPARGKQIFLRLFERASHAIALGQCRRHRQRRQRQEGEVGL